MRLEVQGGEAAPGQRDAKPLRQALASPHPVNFVGGSRAASCRTTRGKAVVDAQGARSGQLSPIFVRGLRRTRTLE